MDLQWSGLLTIVAIVLTAISHSEGRKEAKDIMDAINNAELIFDAFRSADGWEEPKEGSKEVTAQEAKDSLKRLVLFLERTMALMTRNTTSSDDKKVDANDSDITNVELVSPPVLPTDTIPTNNPKLNQKKKKIVDIESELSKEYIKKNSEVTAVPIETTEKTETEIEHENDEYYKDILKNFNFVKKTNNKAVDDDKKDDAINDPFTKTISTNSEETNKDDVSKPVPPVPPKIPVTVPVTHKDIILDVPKKVVPVIPEALPENDKRGKAVPHKLPQELTKSVEGLKEENEGENDVTNTKESIEEVGTNDSETESSEKQTNNNEKEDEEGEEDVSQETIENIAVSPDEYMKRLSRTKGENTKEKEDDATSGVEKEDDATKGVEEKDDATTGERKEEDSTSGVEKEDDATKGVEEKDDATTGERKEEDATSGVEKEDGTTSEIVEEKRTLLNLLDSMDEEAEKEREEEENAVEKPRQNETSSKNKEDIADKIQKEIKNLQEQLKSEDKVDDEIERLQEGLKVKNVTIDSSEIKKTSESKPEVRLDNEIKSLQEEINKEIKSLQDNTRPDTSLPKVSARKFYKKLPWIPIKKENSKVMITDYLDMVMKNRLKEEKEIRTAEKEEEREQERENEAERRVRTEERRDERREDRREDRRPVYRYRTATDTPITTTERIKAKFLIDNTKKIMEVKELFEARRKRYMERDRVRRKMILDRLHKMQYEQDQEQWKYTRSMRTKMDKMRHKHFMQERKIREMMYQEMQRIADERNPRKIAIMKLHAKRRLFMLKRNIDYEKAHMSRLMMQKMQEMQMRHERARYEEKMLKRLYTERKDRDTKNDAKMKAMIAKKLDDLRDEFDEVRDVVKKEIMRRLYDTSDLPDLMRRKIMHHFQHSF